jgi:hypothetical protein
MNPTALAESVTALLAQHPAEGGRTVAGASGMRVSEPGGAIFDALAARLRDTPVAASALEQLAGDAGDSRKRAAFTRHLKRVLKDDPAFAAELASLLESAQAPQGINLRGSGAVATGGSGGRRGYGHRRQRGQLHHHLQFGRQR